MLQNLLQEVQKKRPEISRGTPQDRQEFTGERFLPGYADGSIELQHMHRYAFALPFATGQTVVDIGCGEGYGCDLLAHVAGSVVGVDIDDDIIRRAHQKYVRPNLNFRVGHASAVPIETNSIDLVVSFETLEHLSDHHSFWLEIKRILKTSGLLIVSSPNRDTYNIGRKDPNLFHKRELNHLEFVTDISRHFPNYALFSQATILGSAIVPLSSPSPSKTMVSVDPDTGVLHWKASDEIPQPFSIAIASENTFPVPGESFYTGDYPADAMASLTGGIADRDREIRELTVALQDRNGGRPAPACVTEDLLARDAEIRLLKETALEQARIINALRRLLDEYTRQTVRSAIDTAKQST